MSIPIRALLVSNRDENVLMLAEGMNDTEHSLTLRRVDTLAALEEALRDDSWDVVFARTRTNDLDHHEILKQLKKFGTGTGLSPLVLLTETVQEEEAVAALHDGVQDYILTDRPTRLPVIARHTHQMIGARLDQRRQQAEHNALQTSEERFRYLFEHMGQGVIYQDHNGQITAANPAAESILGLTYNQLIGRTSVGPDWKAIHENGSPFPGEEHPAMVSLRTGQPVRNVVMGVYIPAQKGHSWILINAIPQFHDGEDQPFQVFTTFTDITAQKQIEKALAVNEKRFRSLFDAMTEGVALHEVVYGADGMPVNYRLLDINPAYEKHTGLRADAVRGMLATEVYNTYEAPYLDLYSRVAATGRPEHIETYFAPLERHFHISVFSPGPRLFATVFEDITPRKQMEAELLRLNSDLEARVKQRTAQLEAAMQELEAFSYTVSHDLRAPLRAIDGFTHILLEDYDQVLDDEGKRMMEIVFGEARRMGHLIDDLLAFSRLGREEMKLTPVDMTTLAQSVFDDLRRYDGNHPARLHLSPLPVAYGDPTLLHQVFFNLIDNALKYSRERETAVISISGYLNEGEAVYQVQDNGVGFDMQYKHKLFGVFERLHNPTQFEGTGVGLAIVQRIIYRHGGRVWAEGKVDGGATFYFSLPQAHSGEVNHGI